MVTHYVEMLHNPAIYLLVPSLIIDLIQDGNTNDMFGSWVLDGSGSELLDFYLGDSNTGI